MMNLRRILPILGLVMSATFALNLWGGQSGPPASLGTILNNRALWGKDFPAALAYLPSWNLIDERRVAVFPDRVIGTVPYKTQGDAEKMAANLGPAMRAARPQPNATLADWLRGALRNPSLPFGVESVRFVDDDAYRVVQTAGELQLLPPSLTIAQVEKLIGPPERVKVELIQGETDRRPVDLTLYSYAGGKVVFVETDLAPAPGFVDRVILDVPSVTAVLFKEAR